MLVVGVDGCKSGWVAVSLAGEKFTVEIFSGIADLWDRYKEASVVLIDIPIGLKEKGSNERKCDLEARSLLSSKSKERLTVVEKYLPIAREIIELGLGRFPRSQVGKDDLLDALCLAITAQRGLVRGFYSLPDFPEIDAEGLPMQVLYSD